MVPDALQPPPAPPPPPPPPPGPAAATRPAPDSGVSWDGRLRAELQRLELEHQALVATGVYTEGDHVMRELGREVDVLRRLLEAGPT